MARRIPARPLIWTLGDGAPPPGPHVAVVPGTETPLLALDLPPKLRGIARERVAQRMLSEQMGVPLSDLEVRPFAPKGARAPWTRALVAEAARLEDWRGRLAKGCLALLPDYLALPCAAEVWTIDVAGGTVRARMGVEDGFSGEPELAEILLAEASEGETPKAVLRLGEALASLDDLLAGVGAPVFRDAAALVRDGHRILRWSDAADGIDLKDPPSADFDRLRGVVRRWLAPAAVAVLALAAYLGSVLVETRQLEALRDRDRRLAEGLVREHFVPSGPILDMRAQVTQALAGAGQGQEDTAAEADPLVLFQTAAPYLTGDSISLQSVSYRADGGLVAAVEIVDFAGLDQLVADLRADGFEVELLESSARQGAGVAARLRLAAAEG